MELNLVVPVPSGALRQPGDEEIHGRLWRVNGPDPDIEELKFHCISYVWGTGIEKRGSFFNCQRDISDQTRPALEAAIKAADVINRDLGGEGIDAFWIDALCIPQLEIPARFKTLESMGFIYNTAVSVIIALKSPAWKIVQQASYKQSPDPLSQEDMQILEADAWVSRVWTYQELVNSRIVYFTSLASSTDPKPHVVVEATQFFSCIGHSLSRYKRDAHVSDSTALVTFPNLNVLEDTLLDSTMSGYLERPALGILSNISMRTFDHRFPQNRLLACIGALTKEVSWGPPSVQLGDLAEKIMKICEGKGDYSFVFTADQRSLESRRTWRPDSVQTDADLEPAHLVPVINWYIHSEPFGETQRGRTDSSGFWLENMAPLRLAETMNADAALKLDRLLWGFVDPTNPKLVRRGIFGYEGNREDWIDTLLKFLIQIGFKGCHEPMICETGLFFSQLDLGKCRQVELFAAASIGYYFGAPGLARWIADGQVRYCAGVFVGLVIRECAQSLLMYPVN